MREIEIKARVADKTSIVAALKNLGIELGLPLTQHDVVYSLPGAVAGSSANWLRVRTENDTTVYFTLKRSVTGELDSIEHEVIVSNETEISTIIKYLGYELFSDLTKIRQKAVYGELEICLDEVPELGVFIEAEKLCAEDVNYQAVENELWEFFTQLGLTKADQETRGYDTLLHSKQGYST